MDRVIVGVELSPHDGFDLLDLAPLEFHDLAPAHRHLPDEEYLRVFVSFELLELAEQDKDQADRYKDGNSDYDAFRERLGLFGVNRDDCCGNYSRKADEPTGI